MVLFITGCNSFDMNMSIKNNREMDYSIKVLSKGNYNFEDKVIELKNKLGDSYEVSLYNENGYSSGISISKHYSDIDYISLGERSEEYNLLYFYNNPYSSDIENKMFNLDKSIDTNRYAANFYVDLSEVFTSLDNVSVTFNLTVPNGTLSNNATKVSDDGKSLTWNLTTLGKNDIDFVFEITSYDSLYQLGAIIIAIFLVFMIFTKLLSKSGDVNGSKDDLVSEFDNNIKVNDLTKNAIRNRNNTPNAYVGNNNQGYVNNQNNNYNNGYSNTQNYNNNQGYNMNNSINNNINNNMDNNFNNVNDVNTNMNDNNYNNVNDNVDPKMFGLITNPSNDNGSNINNNTSINIDNTNTSDINTNINTNTNNQDTEWFNNFNTDNNTNIVDNSNKVRDEVTTPVNNTNTNSSNVSFNDIATSGNEEVIKFNNKDVVITKKKKEEE